MNSAVPRRTFFQLCSALAAWLSSPTPRAAASPQSNGGGVRNRKNFVAIQMKPHAWLDEGIEQCLDNLQKGAVNTIWAYTYDWEMGPRNTPNSSIPLPDHGKYGDPKFSGGAFYNYDRRYFTGTMLNDFRSPDYGNWDVIAEVAPKAKARSSLAPCQPASFEVASVKIVETPAVGLPEGFSMTPRRSGGGFHWVTNMPLLLRYAFHLQAWRIGGVPVDDFCYAIDAKGDPAATDDDVRAMLQKLLAERFKLASHHETREMNGFVLTAGKNGPRIKPAQPDDPIPAPPEYFKGRTDFMKSLEGKTILTVEGGLALTGRRVTIAQLAEALQEPLRAPVVDRTAVSGSYYFALRFARDNDPASELPSVFDAVSEQLGLKLEKQKVPVEMLIVDHVESKPTGN